MSERENNKPATANQWSDHVLEFVDKQEFGSSKFKAISDFATLHKLYGKIGDEYQSHVDKASGLANLTPEERRSLVIQSIAILQHSIEQNKAEMSGYAVAFVEISNGFDNMLQFANEEASAKFPNRKEEQTAYIRKIYTETLQYVSESIYEEEQLDL